MQSDDQLPLAQWGHALAAARTENGLGAVEIARELMLSPAQLRNIETGNTQSFHGLGYYFRAVQKYANRLGIVLEPTVDSLLLTDSQLGISRFNKTSSESNSSATATLSRRQSALDNGLKVAPFRSRSSRVGMVLGVILVFAVALGVYLSVGEGWPNSSPTQTANGTQPQVSIGESVQAIPIPITSILDNQVSVPESGSGTTNPEPSLISATAFEATDLVDSMAATLEALPDPVPVQSPPASPPPLADIFEARFTADCWVEVRYSDGRVEQKVYTERDILSVPVDEIEAMVFGNASAVRAQRQGQSFDVMTYAGGRNVARIRQTNFQ